jgi:Tfp pilus assembly pilus retraction ATPase PilT
MELRELLIFAVRDEAAEVHLSADGPIEITAGAARRKLNLPNLEASDFHAMLAPHLDASAREQIRASGRCECQFEVDGVGSVRAEVGTRKARLVLPAAE